MSSVTLGLLAAAWLLAAAGIGLWQRAKSQDDRRAAAASLDDLLNLNQVVRPTMLATGSGPSESTAFGMQETNWSSRCLLRAGLTERPRTWVLGACPPVLLAAVGGVLQGGVLAVLLAAFGTALVGAWVNWRINRQRLALTHAIPGYLDSVVRLMTVGHSVQSAFHNGVVAAETPLGRATAHAARLQSSGVDPDHALQAVGELYGSTELVLLASILRMGMRFGGRADLIVARVAVFIRDREQAQAELMAQSAETRLSAWILGLLPVGLALYIIALNPQYIGRMWADATGQQLLISAIALQVFGAGILYRLATTLED